MHTGTRAGYPPASHSRDPRGSHEAESRVTGSGRRASNMERVLGAVKAAPGQTAGELSQGLGMDVVEVRRRLSDLRGTGRVYRATSRRCEVAGNTQATWFSTGYEPRQAHLL